MISRPETTEEITQQENFGNVVVKHFNMSHPDHPNTCLNVRMTTSPHPRLHASYPPTVFDSNPERCHRQQARYKISHPSPSVLKDNWEKPACVTLMAHSLNWGPRPSIPNLTWYAGRRKIKRVKGKVFVLARLAVGERRAGSENGFFKMLLLTFQ